MRRLFHTVLALSVGLSLAQQYPLPVTYHTVLKSPVDPTITIFLKQPDANTCATGGRKQKQYTGYVNLPPLTLAPFQQSYPINTFFWFFEAQDSPETAPLTIWLSGGPGQSSMTGLFAEVGPCEVKQGPDGSYVTKPRLWSWNRKSNLLFIDQPTQTGFSYDERTNASIDFSNDYPTDSMVRKQPLPLPADVPAWRFKNGTFASGLTTNTEALSAIAARSTWHFLQGFLSTFPQFNPGTRPDSNIVESAAINLFAESYGGVYAPTFADFFELQNERRKNGIISSDALEIHLSSIGIMSGVVDVLTTTTSSLEYAYDNTYGIKGINFTAYRDAIATVNKAMGCRDLIMQCRMLAAANDPNNLGRDENTNNICASAQLACQVAGAPATAVPRSIYDWRVAPQVQPTAAYEEYLNDAKVLQSIGSPVNFTMNSIAVMKAFSFNGDAARGIQVKSLAGLLARGIKVALINGDADLIGNWYGGQNMSLELASLVPGYDTAFPASGYANIVVNASYIGGDVRQYGNLSFSRIYDAGHQIPHYQPETSFAVFSRIVQGRDIGKGREVDLSTFRTKGPSTSHHKNVAPLQSRSVCWIREAASTCTEEERAAIQRGEGLVNAGIWTSSESIAVHEKRSESSSLQQNFLLRLLRRVIPSPKRVEHTGKSRNCVMRGIAVAAAFLFGILSILLCCRCLRRYKHDGDDDDDAPSYPCDTENGPVILKQVLEETPDSLLITFRRPTNLEPIPEASPRPSEDARHAPEKPLALLNWGEVRNNTGLDGTASESTTMPSTPIPASEPFVQHATTPTVPQSVLLLPPRRNGTPPGVHSSDDVV